MEFPELGKHCSEATCKQLDFLPMKCDACSKIFCKLHILYGQHSCSESYKKDNQVPVCPLCNRPIPVAKGEPPDLKVGQHIDNDCQSDPAKERRKIYTNRCSKKGCKTKELIPFKCDSCHMNYCIKHRLAEDHECRGFQGSRRGISHAGAAAVSRAGRSQPSTSRKPASRPQQTTLTAMGRDLDRERRERSQGSTNRSTGNNFNAGMTEDEALAMAMAASMSDQSSKSSSPEDEKRRQQEQEDLALARALAESEQQSRRPRNQQRQNSSEKSSCNVS